MRYAGNYRLKDNPKAKHSHQLRALLKRRDADALRRQLASKRGEVRK